MAYSLGPADRVRFYDRPVRMTGDEVESGWLEGVEVGLGVLGPEVEMAEGAGDAGAEDAVLKRSAYRGARGRRKPRAVCRRPAVARSR